MTPPEPEMTYERAKEIAHWPNQCGVILDVPIQGYRSWNVADLIVVRDKK